MHSSLLACLPLTGGSSCSRVLVDFEEVCHSHGVSGRAFRVVADPGSATTLATTKRPCCLPGFLVSPLLSNGHYGSNEGKMDNDEDTKRGIRNGHGERGDEGGHDESWEQGLGVSRVDCFSRSLEECIRVGLGSCIQISSTLTKAARFYNYITSAVPPEKLSQVFDGLMTGGAETTPQAVWDWAAQLKVSRYNKGIY